MLTRKQKDLLLFIHQRLQLDGVPPSFDEMKDALGLKSKSGIHRLITALEERGFIRRLPNRARALEVVKLPEDVDAGLEGENIVQPKFGRRANDGIPGLTGQELPLVGKIAAGTPIEALENPDRSVIAPPDMLGAGEHYALEVEGDSMIDAGIHDGDTVLIERCETARTGEIIVALIDNEEATLKKLRRRGDSVALEAANPDYETRIFPPQRVKIQGRLVGLMRRY